MNASPAEIALCCGTKCYRGTPGADPCAAAIYGRAIARRAKDAGFVVVPAEASHTLPSSSQTRPDDAVTHAEVARLRTALHGIANWCEAYPAAVFTLEAAEAALAACKAAGISVAEMHGTWAQHLLAGIGENARAALAREAPDAE